jgi:phosphoribosylglycinamide formyltransferase-1
MRIITRLLVEAFPHRIMNIHPALLPSFPGLHVQKAALDHGVKFSGCTVHFVDEGMDTGPIIIQAAVPVLDGDTEDSLAARILKQEHKIFSRAIQLFAEGRLRIEGRRVLIEGGRSESDDFLINP